MDISKLPEKYRTGWISEASGNVILPLCRVDWVYLLKPTKDKIEKGVTKPGYYSVDGVFPAVADFTIVKKVMEQKLAEKFGAKMAIPAFVGKLKQPIKDQAEKLDKEGNMRPGYVAGSKVITLTAKQAYKPGLVDQKGNDIVEPQYFYSGCWAQISVSPFAYDNEGKGVSLGLRNVQLIAYPTDDEMPFGGGGTGGYSKPTEDFEPFTVDAGGSAGGPAKSSGGIFDD